MPRLNYHRYFDELVKYAKERGIVVKLKTEKVMFDYLGMNPNAAKPLGFVIPSNAVYILKSSPIEEKCRTLRHELHEMEEMKEGDSYWQAHKEATCSERKKTMPRMERFKNKQRQVHRPRIGRIG